jgi:hypothetical protein
MTILKATGPIRGLERGFGHQYVASISTPDNGREPPKKSFHRDFSQ